MSQTLCRNPDVATIMLHSMLHSCGRRTHTHTDDRASPDDNHTADGIARQGVTR
jgi:hypothetical protein